LAGVCVLATLAAGFFEVFTSCLLAVFEGQVRPWHHKATIHPLTRCIHFKPLL
jgi:hypothetical protein